MKYYIIAGEASGDLHASNLMKALQKKDAQTEFRFWGGDLMQAVGGTLVKHYKDLAFMGFLEVVMNLGTILSNIKFCKKDVVEFKPDALILVDYPGFNLKIAEFAQKQNIPVHYYISPKIWAWKESRIHNIKRDVDFMYIILPFEVDFFEKKHNYPVNYVGNPLLDEIANRKPTDNKLFRKENNLNEKPIIAILPGSRTQEITKMLSVMLKMVPKFSDYQFVIAGAPSQELSFYKSFIPNNDVAVIENKTYDLLSVSYAALVTSGTATLETAIFKVPQVVCYKAGTISYKIAKLLVKNIKYISLVNLILDKEAVTELIQDDFNEERLEKELQKILDTKGREEMFEDYYELEKRLGGKGASERTAELIFKNLKK
ncbi:MAG: lipid-A-disaccharide synthase [Bacteroidota bacterium]